MAILYQKAKYPDPRGHTPTRSLTLRDVLWDKTTMLQVVMEDEDTGRHIEEFLEPSQVAEMYTFLANFLREARKRGHHK